VPVKPAASVPKQAVRPEPAPAAIAVAPSIEDAPVAPVSSGVSIQLGAFPSSDAAAAHWSRVKGQNQELLGDYSPKFIPVDIPGKGTLYRLRVTGFADKSAAKSVCDQITAGGGACILAGK
jgi:cell division septation protein DedD